VRCGLYHRVSTADQDVALPHDELVAAARARGFEITVDIIETGSGRRHDRPGLRSIIDAAQRGKIGAVLVWKLDRFGRSVLDLLTNILVLDNAGVRFVVVTQGIDMHPGGDPMSRSLLSMLAGVAEFERDLIERTRLGLDNARRQGRHLGRPLGATAPNGATVRDLRDAGRSWGEIARSLRCSPSAARRASKRLAEKGSSSAASVPVENTTAK
jgi:DNA invertase Pin-like site-specific DNA recombinase